MIRVCLVGGSFGFHHREWFFVSRREAARFIRRFHNARLWWSPLRKSKLADCSGNGNAGRRLPSVWLPGGGLFSKYIPRGSLRWFAAFAVSLSILYDDNTVWTLRLSSVSWRYFN